MSAAAAQSDLDALASTWSFAGAGREALPHGSSLASYGRKQTADVGDTRRAGKMRPTQALWLLTRILQRPRKVRGRSSNSDKLACLPLEARNVLEVQDVSLGHAKVELLLIANEQTTRDSRCYLAQFMAHLPDPPLEAMSRSVDRNAVVNPRVTMGCGCVSVHPGQSFGTGGGPTTKRNWEERKRPRKGSKGERRAVTLPSPSHGLSATIGSMCSARPVCFQFPLVFFLQNRFFSQEASEGTHSPIWPGPLPCPHVVMPCPTRGRQCRRLAWAVSRHRAALCHRRSTGSK